jgi:hypothetical protein
MQTVTTYMDRVEAGAKYLDTLAAAGVEWATGWRDRIDVDRLNMRMNSDCVIGQLYGSYWGFMVTAGEDRPMTLTEASALGFYEDPSAAYVWDRYEALRQAWVAYLTD